MGPGTRGATGTLKYSPTPRAAYLRQPVHSLQILGRQVGQLLAGLHQLLEAHVLGLLLQLSDGGDGAQRLLPQPAKQIF